MLHAYVVQLHADCCYLIVSSVPVLRALVAQLSAVIASAVCFAYISPELPNVAAEADPDVHIIAFAILDSGNTHGSDSSSIACVCFPHSACMSCNLQRLGNADSLHFSNTIL